MDFEMKCKNINISFSINYNLWIKLSDTANKQIKKLYINNTANWISSEYFYDPFYIDINNKKLFYNGYSYTIIQI
jgi:hypothetical protein